MTSFFFLMSAHPEVQKRAQSEIDTIVGQGRLPTLDDRESLVYVAAVVKEVLRWGPVAPLGLAVLSCYRFVVFSLIFPFVGLQHRVTEDDTYEGYLIPKGATVIANIWYETSSSLASPKLIESLPGLFCMITTCTLLLWSLIPLATLDQHLNLTL